jgi:peptidoglycan-N-acetylmuramic acid deacetylase
MKWIKWQSAIVIIVIIALLVVIAGVKSRPDGHISVLSDLGGVYSDLSDKIDFSIEISEFSAEGNESRVLSWGTSKRKDHITPGFNPGSVEMLKRNNSACIGDTSKKVIYLTFDEGYENGYTSTILDVLRKNDVRAIFFITGPYLKGSQDLVRRMVEEGHEVGNHTVHHPSLPNLEDSVIEEEVLGLDRAFSEKFGMNMRFLRPPKGEYSERSLVVTNKLGYRNLFWSFAYEDWYKDSHKGADYAYDIIMRNLHNGEVMLLHAVSRDNAEALDRVIKDAKAQGYEFGEPEELLKD